MHQDKFLQAIREDCWSPEPVMLNDWHPTLTLQLAHPGRIRPRDFMPLGLELDHNFFVIHVSEMPTRSTFGSRQRLVAGNSSANRPARPITSTIRFSWLHCLRKGRRVLLGCGKVRRHSPLTACCPHPRPKQAAQGGSEYPARSLYRPPPRRRPVDRPILAELGRALRGAKDV